MMHFLYGEDGFRVRSREEELVFDFLKRFPRAERFVFDAKEEWTARKTSGLLEALSGGLFALPRLVLLREGGDLSDEAALVVKEVLKKIEDEEGVLLIATHRGKIKKTHGLISFLLKKAKSEALEPLSASAFSAYARTLLKKIDAHTTIETAALNQLLHQSGADTGKLFQEITKLALYKRGGVITEQDVKELSQEPIESNIFLALDALVQGNRGRAIALLRREEKLSVPLQRTLGLCAWQLRRLIEVEELYTSGMRQAGAIAGVLKSSPYPIQKLLPHIGRFEKNRLKRGIALLADLDLAIKSGRTEPGVALDLFLWKF